MDCLLQPRLSPGDLANSQCTEHYIGLCQHSRTRVTAEVRHTACCTLEHDSVHGRLRVVLAPSIGGSPQTASFVLVSVCSCDPSRVAFPRRTPAQFRRPQMPGRPRPGRLCGGLRLGRLPGGWRGRPALHGKKRHLTWLETAPGTFPRRAALATSSCAVKFPRGWQTLASPCRSYIMNWCFSAQANCRFRFQLMRVRRDLAML